MAVGYLGTEYALQVIYHVNLIEAYALYKCNKRVSSIPTPELKVITNLTHYEMKI